jgi:hypothetical protein
MATIAICMGAPLLQVGGQAEESALNVQAMTDMIEV